MNTYFKTLGLIYYKRLLRYILPKKNKEYSPFIILSHPRSGSTLLHTYLNYHPNILSLGEYLGGIIRNRECRDQVNAIELIDKKIFTSYSQNIQSVGMKFFFQYTDYSLGRDIISLLASRQNVRVVHLYRDNLLRNLVSLKIAENTGQYTMWKEQQKMEVEKRKIYLPIEECKSQLVEMEEQSCHCRQLFQNHDILPISYESLVNHPNNALSRVQEFLQVKTHKLRSLLLKQNPEPLTELISNYDEIKQALASTKWAKMVKE
jgi:LPS sulfotransferase NodH